MGKLLAPLIAIAVLLLIAWPRSEQDASGRTKYKPADNPLQGAIIEMLERAGQ